MANDLTGNPWKVDTASSTPIWTGKVWLEKMLWHEPSASGDHLQVTDVAGRVIWDKHALAGGSGLDYDLKTGTIFDGIIVPILSSGTLYIYLDQTP
jgi:hypothetical protein